MNTEVRDRIEDLFEWLAETGEVPPHLRLEESPRRVPADQTRRGFSRPLAE